MRISSFILFVFCFSFIDDISEQINQKQIPESHIAPAPYFATRSLMAPQLL